MQHAHEGQRTAEQEQDGKHSDSQVDVRSSSSSWLREERPAGAGFIPLGEADTNLNASIAVSLSDRCCHSWTPANEVCAEEVSHIWDSGDFVASSFRG